MAIYLVANMKAAKQERGSKSHNQLKQPPPTWCSPNILHYNSYRP